MKKMKKRVKAFALAATLILCTLVNVVPAHAAGVSADQYLKKMTKAANKVKSYEATTTTVQNAITNGETANVKTVQKVISFSKPMKAKAVSTTYMKVDGESSKQKTIMYLKKNSKGKTITYVSLDGKKYYYYAHLRKNHPYAAGLTEGAKVTAGDVIGYLGMTGYSTKENVNNINVPHLHFGLQLIFDTGNIFKELQCFLDRHIQYIGNGFPFIFYL